MQILITLQFKIYFFLFKHDKSQSKLSHVSSNVKRTLQSLHSLRILSLARTKEIKILLYLLILLLQKSQCLYLAQGNGILQLEGETEKKKKKTTTTKKKSEINFSGKRR